MLAYTRRPVRYECALARVASARAQEAAAVILQIISRGHAIFLKKLQGYGGDGIVHPGPFSRARARTRVLVTRAASGSYERRERCTRKRTDEGGAFR